MNKPFVLLGLIALICLTGVTSSCGRGSQIAIGDVGVIYDPDQGTVVVGASQEALDAYYKAAAANDDYGKNELLRDGEVFGVSGNTKVRLIGVDRMSMRQVRILEGKHAGMSAYVRYEYLKEVPAGRKEWEEAETRMQKRGNEKRDALGTMKSLGKEKNVRALIVSACSGAGISLKTPVREKNPFLKGNLPYVEMRYEGSGVMVIVSGSPEVKEVSLCPTAQRGEAAYARSLRAMSGALQSICSATAPVAAGTISRAENVWRREGAVAETADVGTCSVEIQPGLFDMGSIELHARR